MARPLTPEEECTETTLPRTYEYFQCLESKGIKLFGINGVYTYTPPQAMNRVVMLIILLIFLHYIKIITLPIVGKYIPQMK